MKKEKKIPTIIGLFFLLISTAVGVFLSSNKVNLSSKASGDCKPTNIQTTNITHNSFSISFVTSAECLSSISINNQTLTNFSQSSRIHYFFIDNLSESTDYAYSIISGGVLYEEMSYLAKTAKKPSGTAPLADIAWGKVYNPDKTPGAYSLVYIIIPEGSPLSALVTNNGNWNIPFANSYNLEKTNWFSPQPNIDEDIFVISQDGQATQITGNTSRNDPVPDIIIGQNEFPSKVMETSSVGSINTAIEPLSSGKITILNPENGETISTLRPDFFGTADPGYTLNLSLTGPVNASGNPISDSTGIWHWSPAPSLVAGNYVIKADTVEHIFSVSGSSISSLAYTASNSAVINTPTPVPSLVPVLSPTPTAISTLSPTIIPTQRSYKPSTSSGVPKTGNTLPTVLLGVVSISLLIFGFLLI